MPNTTATSKRRFSDETNNCICLCGLKFKETKKEESWPNPLENWELWMQRRRKIHAFLGTLGRKPGELLMNIGEEYRNVREDQLVLGYTQIITNFDKLRGNPEFWKLPNSLRGPLQPLNTSEYYVVKSKEEKNEIPGTEYVGVPDYILKEKDIMPRTRSLYKLWKSNNTYRKQVVQRTASKLLEIEPHKPDFHDFILVGNKIKPDTPKDAVLSQSTEPRKLSSSSEQATINSVDNKISRISLKINNLTFTPDGTTYGHNKITLLFEYFMDSMACQQLLIFENTGRVVLRLYWNQQHKLKIFREYCTDSKIFNPFTFPRNEILLLPGQRLEFPIDFKPKRPGNYFECWELDTLPKIWTTDIHLVITFKGFAQIKNFEEKANALRENLDQRVRNTVIKDLLSDLISQGNYSAPLPTRSYDFSEKELFESANLKDNRSVRTPKYVYDKQVIAELNELYQEMRQPDDAAEWNLSIRKLHEISRKKDLLVYFENNVALSETAKLKRNLLQGNLGDDLIHTTREPLKAEHSKTALVPVVKHVGKPRKETIINVEQISQPVTLSYYSRLKDITQKLERPSIKKNADRIKYFYSFAILRTYIFKMFDSLYLLDKENGNIIDDVDDVSTSGLSQNTTENVPKKQPKQLPDRLLYEIFEESYISRTKRIPAESTTGGVAKPKTTLLKGISSTDVKKICKLYFNTSGAEKGQISKNQEQVKASKKLLPPKKTDKSRNSRSQVDQDLLLNIKKYFNPFTEKYHFNLEEKDKSRIHYELDVNSSKEIQNYEEKYLIVYTHLCQAVDGLVEVIDGFRSQNIRSDTLREVQSYFTLPVKSHAKEKDKQKNKIMPTRSTVAGVAAEGLAEKIQSNADKEEYFQFLLETHLENNRQTKKYFVKEKKQATCSATEQAVCKTDDIVRALSNIFSVEEFQRKSPPPGWEDREMQTTLTGMSEKHSREVFVVASKEMETPPSKNIFYFLDNICEQNDLNE